MAGITEQGHKWAFLCFTPRVQDGAQWCNACKDDCPPCCVWGDVGVWGCGVPECRGFGAGERVDLGQCVNRRGAGAWHDGRDLCVQEGRNDARVRTRSSSPRLRQTQAFLHIERTTPADGLTLAHLLFPCAVWSINLFENNRAQYRDAELSEICNRCAISEIDVGPKF